MLTKKQVDTYLASPDVTGLSVQTQKLYRVALGRWLEYRESNAKWSPDQGLYEFVDFLRQSGNAGSSIGQYVTCVKIFARWAGNPIDFRYKNPNGERQRLKRKQMRRWFDEDDIAKILAYPFEGILSPLQGKVIVRLMVETGARVREIANVRAKDVAIEDRLIWLHESKTEPRPAFYSPETAELLTKFLGDLPHRFAADIDRQIFPNTDGIRNIVMYALEDLGLKKQRDGRGPHTFRHYCASYLFYRGNMRIEDIAFLLGDKVETIVHYYLHPTPLMLRDRVDKAMGWDV